MNIQPIERPDWAIRGSLFHTGLEMYYSGEGLPAIELDSDINSIVSGVLKSYVEFYNDKRENLKIEMKFTIDNPSIMAYIDMIDGDTIIDHKLAKSEPTLLNVGYQASIYHRVIPDAEKFMINFVKVPQLKKKETESFEDFVKRIFEAVRKEPNKYFSRMTYSLSEFYLFECQIDNIINEINSMRNKHIDYYYMNTSSCYLCDYDDICLRKTIDDSKYTIGGERSGKRISYNNSG